jgi:hypothetical protein
MSLVSGNVGIGSTAPAAKLDLPTGFFRALAGTVSGLGSSGNVVVMADNSGNLFATSSSSLSATTPLISGLARNQGISILIILGTSGLGRQRQPQPLKLKVLLLLLEPLLRLLAMVCEDKVFILQAMMLLDTIWLCCKPVKYGIGTTNPGKKYSYSWRE